MGTPSATGHRATIVSFSLRSFHTLTTVNCLPPGHLPFTMLAARRCLAKPAQRLVAGSSSSRALHSTPRAAKLIQLEVDGKQVEIEQGSSLIQACEKAGATIPRFCYHDRLAIAGNCRMCLVEVSPGPPKPQASCAMPAMPGQKVKTDSPLIAKAREGVMEFLLANHPLDCPICDQGGQCDLQDQSMRYGSDRTRFHEITGKRAVEDKDMGPLVKTVMTRCIHCTRCVRFANEVAGVDELGTSGRGNEMQIGTYVQKVLNTEMSGNVIDLCPVGALTSKPYAFQARPWELKKTESVDVLDAVGSNIRIDSRGTQVYRIQPRVNDDINEEWIHDKTRFAYDGLKYQRLTTPLVRQGDKFVPASWPQALDRIAQGLAESGAQGNEIKAVAGSLADTESLVALKDLMNKLGSDNTTLDTHLGSASVPPVTGVDLRSNYTFNTTLAGAEASDAVLLIGTNPRTEAAILNTRLRKAYLNTDVEIALIGEDFKSTFEYEHVGTDLNAVKSFLGGSAKGAFADRFKSAKKPMIIVGSGIYDHADGPEVLKTISEYVVKHADKFVSPEWQGFNVLQRSISHTAAYDIGFAPPAAAAKVTPKFVYLLNADDFEASAIPKNAFVVYQGHHGDVGASYADVCLPGSAYTEKSSTYVNTEGRVQVSRAAVGPPGASREDWKIVRALSEILGETLPYDDTAGLRDRMWEISPTLNAYDTVDAPSNTLVGLKQLAAAKTTAQNKAGRTGPLKSPIENFYRTDPISRSSVTMAKCTDAFVKNQWTEHDEEKPLAGHA